MSLILPLTKLWNRYEKQYPYIDCLLYPKLYHPFCVRVLFPDNILEDSLGSKWHLLCLTELTNRHFDVPLLNFFFTLFFLNAKNGIIDRISYDRSCRVTTWNIILLSNTTAWMRNWCHICIYISRIYRHFYQNKYFIRN